MKKNIEVVRLDSSVILMLTNLLQISDKDEIKELSAGLENLKDGRISSLLIELEGTEESSGFMDKMTFGNLSIQIASRRVVEGNREINLTPKEFDILCFLASHSGQVFTKEQIYQEVWETSYCLDDSNIMAFIRKLRKKIEPDPDSPIYILTVWGTGYKFNDRIE